MTRPIDETWSLAEHGVNLVHPDGLTSGILWSEQERDMGRTLEERDAHRALDRDRARLAAQAPAMARLLIDLQDVDYDAGRGCGSCYHPSPGHNGSCALIAVLRAAGVVE